VGEYVTAFFLNPHYKCNEGFFYEIHGRFGDCEFML